MIIQIEEYFIGMIFKGNQLVRNTIPLRREEIFNFMDGEVVSNPEDEHLKVAEIILNYILQKLMIKK